MKRIKIASQLLTGMLANPSQNMISDTVLVHSALTIADELINQAGQEKKKGREILCYKCGLLDTCLYSGEAVICNDFIPK